MNKLQKLKNLMYNNIKAIFNGEIPVFLNTAPLDEDGALISLPVIIIHRQSVKFSNRLITMDASTVEVVWNISCINTTSELCDDMANKIFEVLGNVAIEDSDLGRILNYVDSLEDSLTMAKDFSQIDLNMRQVLASI